VLHSRLIDFILFYGCTRTINLFLFLNTEGKSLERAMLESTTSKRKKKLIRDKEAYRKTFQERNKQISPIIQKEFFLKEEMV